MKAFILTGGQGTRLRPLTLTQPKPLLPIANQPFLSYPLSLLRKHGIHSAALCMADSAMPYKKFIAIQKKLGTTVDCSRELKPLGTAGAIKNAERFLDSEMFFVFNGDVLTDIDLSGMIRFHQKSGAFISVALVHVPDPSPYGLAVLDRKQEIKKFIEKPSLKSLKKSKSYLINAGTYLFSRQALDLIPKNQNFSVENQLYPMCLQKQLPIYGFVTPPSTYWLDIGTPQKYLQANLDIVTGRVAKISSQKQWKKVGEKSMIHRSARLSDDTVIGSGCRIGKNVQLKECVLLDHVTVEDDCILEGCILGNGARVGHHSQIQGLKTIGDRSHITAYSRII